MKACWCRLPGSVGPHAQGSSLLSQVIAGVAGTPGDAAQRSRQRSGAGFASATACVRGREGRPALPGMGKTVTSAKEVAIPEPPAAQLRLRRTVLSVVRPSLIAAPHPGPRRAERSAREVGSSRASRGGGLCAACRQSTLGL